MCIVMAHVQMCALQSPFYGDKLNLYALCRKIEKCTYPPLPSDVYTLEVTYLCCYCFHPALSIFFGILFLLPLRLLSLCASRAHSSATTAGGQLHQHQPGRTPRHYLCPASRSGHERPLRCPALIFEPASHHPASQPCEQSLAYCFRLSPMPQHLQCAVYQ